MEKIYILDTNVLIQAPYAVECFEDNEVVLPMTVLEELDNLKKEEGEKGANVRKAIRILETHRGNGNLIEGVRTEQGGILRVEKNYLNVELPPDLPEHKSDNRILKVCLGLSKEGLKQVILVTKDILLWIKAQLLGIQAEDFTTEQVAGHEEQYLGRKEVFVSEELFKDFKKKGVPVEHVYCCDSNGTCSHPELFENEQEKISPLMRPIMDNLEQLVDSNDGERYSNEQELQDKVQEIFDRGLIQTEALTFIRGRSIIKTYLIIDEAQNMTPAQIKGIITRAGKETKIVLLGDPNQIDRPYLDDRTNGLSYAAEHMKGSPLCWQITLLSEECERSALATEAICRL